MWQVHNMHWYGPERPIPDGAVYIGRERRGQPRGPLANSYSTEQNRASSVTVVDDPMRAYRRWLWAELRDHPPGVSYDQMSSAYREIRRLAMLPDGVLLCWCKPKPCHGDIVAAAVEWFRTNWDYPIVKPCRSCGALVCFALTPTNKKPCPFNVDVVRGVVTEESHFATCPQASDWSKK